MNHEAELLRHLLDLYHQADSQCTYTFSGFLTPAEQGDFEREVGRSGLFYSFEGGYPAAERRILVCGSEADFGYAPELPLMILYIRPSAVKFGEELSHRDVLGAILNLGIERSLIGDIVVREKEAWFCCLDSIGDYLRMNLDRVKHTTVKCEEMKGEVPELNPRFQELKLNVASERLDALVAELTGLSRAQASNLFPADKVQVNGRVEEEGSKHLKTGDVLSVRGFGKAVYDGIEYETRKGRFAVRLRKYI